MKARNALNLFSRVLVIPSGGTIGAKAYQSAKMPPKFVDTLESKDSVELMHYHLGDDNVDYFDWQSAGVSKSLVKDSKLFDMDDMHTLASVIANNDMHNHTVVTHGTDIMAENATMFKDVFKQYAQYGENVVAFTGAMVPLSMHQQKERDGVIIKSDGLAALSFAINNICEKQAGVYLVARDSHTKRLDFFDPKLVEKDWTVSKSTLEFNVKDRGRGI